MQTNPHILVRLAGFPMQNLTQLSIDESIVDQLSEKEWIDIRKKHIHTLIKLSKLSVFQNGLLYSSHSFIDRLNQLYTKDITEYRKKEKQSLRRITQYLGRIGTKTVPFSSFTAISILFDKQIPKHNQLLLNSHILEVDADIEKIALNPTLHRIGNFYYWFSIKEKDNIRLLHHSELSPFVFNSSFILKKDLVDNLTKFYQIDSEMAIEFIDNLISNEVFIHHKEVTFKALSNISQKYVAKQVIDKEFISNLYNSFGNLSFPKEKILYEHCYIPNTIEIQKEQLHPIKSQLFSLYQFLYFYHQNELNEQLNIIWAEICSDNELEIPFTIFYERFLEQKLEIPTICIQYEYDYQINNDVAFIQLSHAPNPSPPSFGVICQYFNGNDKIQAYLNDFTGGYGKYFGRFIPLLSEKIYQNILTSNRNSTFNLAENPIFQPTNIDVHPPLLDSEVKFTKDLKVVKKGKNISLKQNDKEIKVLDFSIEHPKYKSLRYQLLNLFGFPNISKSNIIKQISQKIKQDTAFGVHIQQIQYQDIILQRERWLIRKDAMVNANIKSDFQFFQMIQQWKNKLNLPQYCLVSSKDHQKLKEPQYIDFHSPHFVNLFQNISKKIKTEIIIEKMTPLPHQILKQGGMSFSNEFLIEFEEN